MKIEVIYKHVSMSNDNEPNRLIIDSLSTFYQLKYMATMNYQYTYVTIYIVFNNDDSMEMRRVVPAHRFGKSIMNLIRQEIANYHLQDLEN